MKRSRESQLCEKCKYGKDMSLLRNAVFCPNFSNQIIYIIYMDNKYRHTKTTVSMLNYHFVFCPNYRRKIFLIDGVEARFKELVYQICGQNNMEVLALECHIDHCHLFVNAPPKLSPSDIMWLIKTNTGPILMAEFEQLSRCQHIWTRSYFVTTAGNACNATIEEYIKNQKTHS